MNDLIVIRSGVVGESHVETVDARELHAFLEVGKDFATWIKDRIEQYDFTENQDFVIAPQNWGAVFRGGGHNRKDYHITLDMAKELAMVERNDKGKQARQYFIECERKLKEDAEAKKPKSQSEIILMLAQQNVAIEQAVAHQQQQLSNLQDRIELVADSRVMAACPPNAEPITAIRRRIGLKHGLSEVIITEVMRQHPAAPKPAGLVLNDNEQAQGSKYAVYWKQDVNRLFKLFLSEATQVTPTMFEHPLISNRFKARVE